MAKDTEDIYDEEGRESQEDESEITPEEEGFMKGYDEAEEEAEEKPKDEEPEEKKEEKESEEE